MKSLTLFALLALSSASAFADSAFPNADYECVYGCRQTDANPRLEIDGATARCWNEFGGLYLGEFRPPDQIVCFRKFGRLVDGGARIEWSDGVIWRRR